MPKKSTVALVRCKSYDAPTCDAAVARALELIGGIGAFVKRGQRVFVKPNLLLAASPERACTTHPAALRPLLRALVEAGADVSFGDLPGGFHVGNTGVIYDKCGMTRIAGETGARLVRLEQFGFRAAKAPGGVKMRALFVPKYLDDMDALINVPKLKTHMEARYTGAVKNLFGFIPTKDRMAAHRHKGCADFSVTLVDIFSVFKPQLNLMDAVVGMEGAGPSQGTPVNLGFVLASADAVALDAVACSAVGFDPATVPSTVEAARRGLGAMRLDDIHIAGDTIASVRRRIKPPSTAVSMLLPFVSGFLNKATEVKPRIEGGACTKCRACVEVCPADAIRTEGRHFVIDDAKCIRCFCCHEMCAHKALALRKPPLVRLAENVMARRR